MGGTQSSRGGGRRGMSEARAETSTDAHRTFGKESKHAPCCRYCGVMRAQDQRLRVVASDMVLWRLRDVHGAVVRTARVVAAQEEELRLQRDMVRQNRLAAMAAAGGRVAGRRESGKRRFSDAGIDYGHTTTSGGLTVVVDDTGHRRLVLSGAANTHATGWGDGSADTLPGAESGEAAREASLTLMKQGETPDVDSPDSDGRSRGRRGSVAIDRLLAEGTGRDLVDELRLARRRYRKELGKPVPLSRLGFLEVFSDLSVSNPAYGRGGAKQLEWEGLGGVKAQSEAAGKGWAAAPRRHSGSNSLDPEPTLFGTGFRTLDELRDGSVAGSDHGSAGQVEASTEPEELIRLLDDEDVRAFCEDRAAAAAAGLLGSGLEPGVERGLRRGDGGDEAGRGEDARGDGFASSDDDDDSSLSDGARGMEAEELVNELVTATTAWRPALGTRHLTLSWSHFFAFVMPPAAKLPVPVPQPVRRRPRSSAAQRSQVSTAIVPRPPTSGQSPAGVRSGGRRVRFASASATQQQQQQRLRPRRPGGPPSSPTGRGSAGRSGTLTRAGQQSPGDELHGGRGAAVVAISQQSDKRSLDKLPRPGIPPGHVDATEVLVSLALLCRGPLEGRMRTVFLLFDTRQRGALSRHEAAHMLLTILSASYRCGITSSRILPREEDLLFSDLFLCVGEVVAPVGLAAAASGGRTLPSAGGGNADGGDADSPLSDDRVKENALAADRDLVLWSFLPKSSSTGRRAMGLHAMAFSEEREDLNDPLMSRSGAEDVAMAFSTAGSKHHRRAARRAAAKAKAAAANGGEVDAAAVGIASDSDSDDQVDATGRKRMTAADEASAAASLLPEPVIREDGFLQWLRQSPAAVEFLKLVESRRIALIQQAMDESRISEHLGECLLEEAGIKAKGSRGGGFYGIGGIAPASRGRSTGTGAESGRDQGGGGNPSFVALTNPAPTDMPGPSSVPFADVAAARDVPGGGVDAGTVSAIAEQDRVQGLVRAEAEELDRIATASFFDTRQGGRRGSVAALLGPRVANRRRSIDIDANDQASGLKGITKPRHGATELMGSSRGVSSSRSSSGKRWSDAAPDVASHLASRIANVANTRFRNDDSLTQGGKPLPSEDSDNGSDADQADAAGGHQVIATAAMDTLARAVPTHARGRVRPPLHQERLQHIATDSDCSWLAKDLGFSTAEIVQLRQLFALYAGSNGRKLRKPRGVRDEKEQADAVGRDDAGVALSDMGQLLAKRNASALMARHGWYEGQRVARQRRQSALGAGFGGDALDDGEDDAKLRPFRNTLEASEFRGLMMEALQTEGGKATTNRLFQLFDLNSDGTISFQEWITGLALLTRGSKRERLQLIFEVWDSDGNGQLDAGELSSFAQAAARRAISSDAEAAGEGDDDMSWHDFAGVLVSMLDADGDGVVTQEDFASACIREPALFECFARAIAPALARADPLKFEFAEGLIRKRKAKLASRARAEQVRISQEIATLDFSILRRVWSKFVADDELGYGAREAPAGGLIPIDQYTGRIRVRNPTAGRGAAAAKNTPASGAAEISKAPSSAQSPASPSMHRMAGGMEPLIGPRMSLIDFLDFMETELGVPAELHSLLRKVHAFFGREIVEEEQRHEQRSRSTPTASMRVPLMAIFNGVARAMAGTLHERGKWFFKVLSEGAPTVPISEIKQLLELTRKGTASAIAPRLAAAEARLMAPQSAPASSSAPLSATGAPGSAIAASSLIATPDGGLSLSAVELACFGLPSSSDRILKEIDKDKDGEVSQAEFAEACEVDPRLLQLLAVVFGGRAPRSRIKIETKKQAIQMAEQLELLESKRPPEQPSQEALATANQGDRPVGGTNATDSAATAAAGAAVELLGIPATRALLQTRRGSVVVVGDRIQSIAQGLSGPDSPMLASRKRGRRRGSVDAAAMAAQVQAGTSAGSEASSGAGPAPLDGVDLLRAQRRQHGGQLPEGLGPSRSRSYSVIGGSDVSLLEERAARSVVLGVQQGVNALTGNDGVSVVADGERLSENSASTDGGRDADEPPFSLQMPGDRPGGRRQWQPRIGGSGQPTDLPGPAAQMPRGRGAISGSSTAGAMSVSHGGGGGVSTRSGGTSLWGGAGGHGHGRVRQKRKKQQQQQQRYAASIRLFRKRAPGTRANPCGLGMLATASAALPAGSRGQQGPTTALGAASSAGGSTALQAAAGSVAGGQSQGRLPRARRPEGPVPGRSRPAAAAAAARGSKSAQEALRALSGPSAAAPSSAAHRANVAAAGMQAQISPGGGGGSDLLGVPGEAIGLLASPRRRRPTSASTTMSHDLRAGLDAVQGEAHRLVSGRSLRESARAGGSQASHDRAPAQGRGEVSAADARSAPEIRSGGAWMMLSDRVSTQQEQRLRDIQAKSLPVTEKPGSAFGGRRPATGGSAAGGGGGMRHEEPSSGKRPRSRSQRVNQIQHTQDKTSLVPSLNSGGSGDVMGAGMRAQSTAEALAALKAIDSISKEATDRANAGKTLTDAARRVYESKLASKLLAEERAAAANQRAAAALRGKQQGAIGGIFGANLRDAGERKTTSRVVVVKGRGGAGMGANLLGVPAADARLIELTRASLDAAVASVTQAQRDYTRSLDSMRRRVEAAKHAKGVATNKAAQLASGAQRIGGGVRVSSNRARRAPHGRAGTGAGGGANAAGTAQTSPDLAVEYELQAVRAAELAAALRRRHELEAPIISAGQARSQTERRHRRLRQAKAQRTSAAVSSAVSLARSLAGGTAGASAASFASAGGRLDHRDGQRPPLPQMPSSAALHAIDVANAPQSPVGVTEEQEERSRRALEEEAAGTALRQLGAKAGPLGSRSAVVAPVSTRPADPPQLSHASAVAEQLARVTAQALSNEGAESARLDLRNPSAESVLRITSRASLAPDAAGAVHKSPGSSASTPAASTHRIATKVASAASLPRRRGGSQLEGPTSASSGVLRSAGASAVHSDTLTLREVQSQDTLAGRLVSTSGLFLRSGGRNDVVWQRGQRARAAASKRRVPKLELRAAGEAIMEAKEGMDSDDEADMMLAHASATARSALALPVQARKRSDAAPPDRGAFTSRH